MKKSSRDRRKIRRKIRNHSCNNCKYFLVNCREATWVSDETIEFYCDNPITAQYKAEEELDPDLFDYYPLTCGGYATT
jgi:RNase P subunit RPR2